MSMLPQLQSQPRFLPLKFKGQEEGWEPHLHRHHFTFLSVYDWSTQYSTDHAVSHHKAEGIWDSPASKVQPLSQYRPHGLSFLLWKGYCTLIPSGIQIQRLHSKTSLGEEISFLWEEIVLLPNSSLKQILLPGQECPVLAPPKWQENHLRSKSYPIHRVAWRSNLDYV